MRQYLTEAVGENVKERWQGRLLWARWEDDLLREQGRFVWLSGWACAPTPAIAGFMELYEQLLLLLTSGRRLKEDRKKTDTKRLLRSLIQLSRSLTLSSPVSLNSVLIYVVEGHHLFAIPCVGTHVIRCCTGEHAQKEQSLYFEW